jgi:hypothetical protein
MEFPAFEQHQRPHPLAGTFSASGCFVCSQGTLCKEDVDLSMRNFVAYDVDGDGVISRADFRAAMVAHDPTWSKPEKSADLERLFRSVDTAGTGLVRFVEFCVMRVQKQRKLTAKPANVSAVDVGGHHAAQARPSMVFIDRDGLEPTASDSPMNMPVPKGHPGGLKSIGVWQVEDDIAQRHSSSVRSVAELEKENVAEMASEAGADQDKVRHKAGRLGLRRDPSLQMKRRKLMEMSSLANAASVQDSDMLSIRRESIYRF